MSPYGCAVGEQERWAVAPALNRLAPLRIHVDEAGRVQDAAEQGSPQNCRSNSHEFEHPAVRFHRFPMTNSSDVDHGLRGDVTEYHQHNFDPTADSVSDELVHAVAEVDDIDPTELTILADVVDPDALDALFRSPPSTQPCDTTGQVVFTYDDHPVEITFDGSIFIGAEESGD